MKPSKWSKLRRGLLCRIGVHYDAECSTTQRGTSYLCCYDCGLLRHGTSGPEAERKTVIQRKDGTWLAVAIHRVGGAGVQ
jgi:hypothetical protein